MEAASCKIALVSTPSQNYWHPSPSITFLKGVLNVEGFNSTCFDLNHAFLTEFGHKAVEWCEQGVNHIPEYDQFILDYCEQFFDYDWIAVSVFTLNSQIFTKRMLELIRDKTDAKIVLGGAGITNNHSDLKLITRWFGSSMVEEGLADHYISGEGDKALPALLRGEPYRVGPMTDLDNLPYPDYSDIDFDTYTNPTIIVTGSRGCVRNCTFCDVSANWKKFTYRPGDEVAEEMIDQYLKYGIKKFNFSDSLVNGSMKEFRVFCKTLAEANLPIEWRGQFIFRKGMTDEDWDDVKASGCKGLWVGIESGSESVRWHMKKKFDNDALFSSVKALGERGIYMLFLLIVGYPTETEEDFQDTLDLLDYSAPYAHCIEIRTNIAMLMPDTEIFEDKNLWHGEVDHWKSFTEDGEELTYAVRYDRWNRLTEHGQSLGFIKDHRIEQQRVMIERKLAAETKNAA